MASIQEVQLAEMGDRLEARRKAKGLSRGAVAKAAGVRVAAVVDAEYGAEVPRAALDKISRALGLSESALAGAN